MISMICGLISIGCAVCAICINLSMTFNGYDLFELPNSDKLLRIRSDHAKHIDSKYRVLYGVSRKECKAYAEIKGKKIK